MTLKEGIVLYLILMVIALILIQPLFAANGRDDDEGA